MSQIVFIGLLILGSAGNGKASSSSRSTDSMTKSRLSSPQPNFQSVRSSSSSKDAVPKASPDIVNSSTFFITATSFESSSSAKSELQLQQERVSKNIHELDQKLADHSESLGKTKLDIEQMLRQLRGLRKGRSVH